MCTSTSGGGRLTSTSEGSQPEYLVPSNAIYDWQDASTLNLPDNDADRRKLLVYVGDQTDGQTKVPYYICHDGKALADGTWPAGKSPGDVCYFWDGAKEALSKRSDGFQFLIKQPKYRTH